ncbi:NAD(P)/FAD-dependent oxidoreductase [Jonesia quinghaiensis]|uniref:NAD(P)/FAD-dependent oxidoreductase n=1 Tax=Jonesia quinghaiensis TaxID=262806 RepID=UPI0004155107|nr:FAD-dependent oxidoreductase [Jonesia quinghaiensis]
MERESVVIIGGGLAAIRTAAALRHAGHQGVITVVSQESSPPYDRPPLSKELLTREQPAWLSEELGITVETVADHVFRGTTAQTIVPITTRDTSPATSPTQHTDATDRWAVTTNTGHVITATHCVIATGSTPTVPNGWENVHTMRTLDDAERLRSAITNASADLQVSNSHHIATNAPSQGASIVIIGAGWIGLELAGHLTHHGHQVTVLESGPSPLWRQLGPTVGQRIGALHPDVTLQCNTIVTSVNKQPATTRTCVTYTQAGTTNTVTADVVITAVGVRPATHWLATPPEGSSPVITREDGLLTTTPTGAVHQHGHTLAGLYAVGDCAIRYDNTWGDIMPGHWNIALTDPERIAHDVLGIAQPASTTPHVFSTQGAHHVDVFGVPHLANEVIFREISPTSWLAAWLSPNGAATALMIVNSPRDTSAARRIFRNGPISIDPRAFADPTIPLKNVALTNDKGVSALAHRAETPLS